MKLRESHSYPFYVNAGNAKKLLVRAILLNSLYLKKQFSLSGELKSFEMKSDRGSTVSSQFCPTCGNPILKKSSGYPGLVFFHAATLETPELFSPEKAFWCSSGQPWDHVNPKLEMMQNA
jgi:Glutathione-dependent formaldehyde-activating enzyme.